MNKTLIVIISIALTLFMSCSHSSHTHVHNDGHEETFQEHITHVEEHFETGPFIDVTPSAIKETAPDISEDHTCYKLTSKSNEGWIQYIIDHRAEAMDQTLHIDRAGITPQLLDENGVVVKSEPVDLSGITANYIRSSFKFHELKFGKAYYIKLSGLPIDTTVKITIEPSYGGEHHDHNH